MGIEAIHSVLKRNRLRWFGHVEEERKRIGGARPESEAKMDLFKSGIE